jgi:putative membrane protein
MGSGRRNKGQGEGDVWKGLAAGLVGGLVASWTMNRFQDVWSKLAEEFGQSEEESSARDGNGESQEARGGGGQTDDATVKAASAISEGIFDHRLTKGEKKVAGPAVHYAFGASAGGLYGAVAEVAPGVTAGAGLPFGAAFWLVADETAVPLLGLSKGPTEYPLSTHAYALASHLVYGLTAEAVRRTVRGAL